MVTVATAVSEEGISIFRSLVIEYWQSLGIEFDPADLRQELDSLPGEYSPPEGMILLAFDRGVAIGCIALRPLSSKICEMKRLYVKPSNRGMGVGQTLVDELIRRAVAVGYAKMRLDTLPKLTEAISLYESRGFVRIPRYNSNPVPGVIFFQLDLLRSGDK